MNYEIITLPGYRAVGLKWEGKYSEITPHLKDTIRKMVERSIELEYRLDPHIQLGLSYHVIKNGFVHYSVYEVSNKQEVPNGMIEINVPTLKYVKTTHNKGEDIQNTYTNLHKWFFESDYLPYKEMGVDYYDSIPIKHERYPVDRDPNDPHFEIYIPIVKKKNTS